MDDARRPLDSIFMWAHAALLMAVPIAAWCDREPLCMCRAACVAPHAMNDEPTISYRMNIGVTVLLLFVRSTVCAGLWRVALLRCFSC